MGIVISALVTFWVGFLIYKKYKPQPVLFLGGMIAMSSTTIIYKAFDDLGLRKKKFTGLVLSVLILEDILAIVLMVMLSTMAVRDDVQRQGHAGYLMQVTEDEVRRRFIASGVSERELILVITTVKERNFEFYSRKGYTLDYEIFYDKEHSRAEDGFHVAFMSKAVSLPS